MRKWDKLLFALSRDVPWISHSWLPVTVLTLHLQGAGCRVHVHATCRVHVHRLLELGKGIGRYRVLKTLTFKTRASAKPFLWKWVLYAWEWQIVFISIGLRLALKQRQEKKFTYSFSLFAQHTRMFNKPMWSLRLLVSITSNNISFDNPLLHKSKASPFQNVT